MLDVRRMQVLRAVVASGSITAAARNLGYSASAISQQLATLEREAGIPLLERIGRGVRPTAAGTLLAEQVEIVSAQLAQTETALTELKEGRTGRLSIRYFATAGAALVPPAVAAVRREYPGIRFDLRLFEDNAMPLIASGEADVAIVVLPQGGSDVRNVEFVPLLDDPYRAVLPRGHRLARKRALDLADLAEEPWIGAEWPTPGPCRDILFDACGAAGFTPNFTVEAEDYQTAQGFVAAGLGVTLVPELGLGSPHPGVVVRPLRRPEPLRSIQAAVGGHVMDRPATRALIAAMRAR